MIKKLMYGTIFFFVMLMIVVIILAMRTPVCSEWFFKRFYMEHHRYPELIHWKDDLSSFTPTGWQCASMNPGVTV